MFALHDPDRALSGKANKAIFTISVENSEFDSENAAPEKIEIIGTEDRKFRIIAVSYQSVNFSLTSNATQNELLIQAFKNSSAWEIFSKNKALVHDRSLSFSAKHIAAPTDEGDKLAKVFEQFRSLHYLPSATPCTRNKNSHAYHSEEQSEHHYYLVGERVSTFSYAATSQQEACSYINQNELFEAFRSLSGAVPIFRTENAAQEYARVFAEGHSYEYNLCLPAVALVRHSGVVPNFNEEEVSHRAGSTSYSDVSPKHARVSLARVDIKQLTILEMSGVSEKAGQVVSYEAKPSGMCVCS